MGSGKIEFYPLLDHLDKVQLLATNFIIEDAKLISDWNNDFGVSSFYLAKIKYSDGGQDKEATTILSGQAIQKQLRKLLDLRKLPVSASLTVVKSGKGNEYYLLDNPIVKSES